MESEQECRESYDGHLASVPDLETNYFLVSLMSTNAFIGGYKGADGHWQWTDGSFMDYTNWIPGTPDNNGGWENYIEIFFYYGRGFWNDMTNKHKHTVYHGFICQVEKSCGSTCEGFKFNPFMLLWP